MSEDDATTDEQADADSDGADSGEGVVRRDRFAGGPAREFMSSLDADRRIFEADLAVDRAHTLMLAEQEIIEEDTAGEILAALDDIEEAVESEGYGAVLSEGEDVHEAIETAVIERVGPEGGRMHTARSRNDEVATCIRYRLREDVIAVLEAVAETREVLVEAAEEHSETLLPGYTHLQPAQPITVGFWLASYEAALARDASRLLDAFTRINESPLGAAAFAGTTFDVDRQHAAALLGFDGIVENAMDAVSTRDFLLETAGALSGLSVTLSGIAEDLVVYSNRGFVDLDDDYASTSSIMPQKKNPDSLELVRAVAGDAAGAHQALATTLTGLPRSYNRDLQRAGPHVWNVIDDVADAVDVAGGAIATAEWNEETCAAAAGEGFSTATGVADLLAQSGVPFRTAHEVVAVAAEDVAALEDDQTAGGAADPDAAIDVLDDAAHAVLGESITDAVEESALRSALDPTESVASRDSAGGPAPSAVEDAIESAKASLEDDLIAIVATRKGLEGAQERLESGVSEYV
ncbi:argininosuccinate lyase [Salinarchaeum sp. Harcht-Bsk1]|uniref:argininosuccinate lyase n=1 Tax=Salinarchaeum sp. Harcht-Bsk1 TaxID=1333523 RepID=UPI00034242E9|nr:argininosuccinate lyase [Salinarchaeum sp. Harcht-Bsk1]AGN01520.1 argininosuccinate lyase [Salinarchaeum sp. Harcht-Bsk1]